MSVVLLDTSVVIALATAALDHLPDADDEVAVATMTIAELHHGLLRATPERLGPRLTTMRFVERSCVALPLDERVAEAYGRVAADAQRIRGRRIAVADGIIAATAIAHGIRLYTRDADFDELPGLDAMVV